MEPFYKVLVVDDEMLIRQGIIHYVDWEQNGYQIVGEAANGEEAIEKIEQVKPHILLTDIVMPGMDGIELIQYVKKYYPAVEIVVLSSYDEFEYVRQTFQLGVADYMLKPKLNEKEILSILNRLITNHTASQQDHTPLSVEEVLPKIMQGYATVREKNDLTQLLGGRHLLLIEVFTKPNQTISITKNKLVGIAERKRISLEVCEVSTSENRYLYLLHSKQVEALHHICLELEKLVNTDKLTVGEIFTDVVQMKEATKKLDTAKRFHFYLPNQRILHTNKLPHAKRVSESFDFHHFIQLVRHQQLEQAFTYTDQYLHAITKAYGMEIHEFQSWLGNICFNLIVLLHHMEIDTSQLEEKKYDFIKRVHDAIDVEEALFVYEELITEVRELLLQQEERPSLIEQIQDYIEENYSQTLTLESLAATFHFHPSYLSSYFSKHRKQGVNEYLHQVRIDQAKQLLMEEKLAISTISEKVGYSDPSYFTKVFKKIEGVSPRHYRKRQVPEWKDVE